MRKETPEPIPADPAVQKYEDALYRRDLEEPDSNTLMGPASKMSTPLCMSAANTPPPFEVKKEPDDQIHQILDWTTEGQKKHRRTDSLDELNEMIIHKGQQVYDLNNEVEELRQVIADKDSRIGKLERQAEILLDVMQHVVNKDRE